MDVSRHNLVLFACVCVCVFATYMYDYNYIICTPQDFKHYTANTPQVHLVAIVAISQEALWSTVPASGNSKEMTNLAQAMKLSMMQSKLVPRLQYLWSVSKQV